MKKTSYLTRFSRALRWYLEEREAEEVLCDYEDIFEYLPDSMEEDPRQKARKLASWKSYSRWMAVFFLLSLSIVLAWYSVYQGDFRKMLPLAVSSFFIGTAAGVIRLRKAGRKRARAMPRNAVKTKVTWLFSAVFLIELAALYQIGNSGADSMAIVNGLKWLCLCLMAAGVSAVFLSRLQTVRWMVLYLLCLALILGCYAILFVVCDMSGTYGLSDRRAVAMTVVLIACLWAGSVRWAEC